MQQPKVHTNSTGLRPAYTYSLNHTFKIGRREADRMVSIASGKNVNVFIELDHTKHAKLLRRAKGPDDHSIQKWVEKHTSPRIFEPSLDLMRTTKLIIDTAATAEVTATDATERHRLRETADFLEILTGICNYTRENWPDITLKELIGVHIFTVEIDELACRMRDQAMFDAIKAKTGSLPDHIPIILLGAHHISNIAPSLGNIGLKQVELNAPLAKMLKYQIAILDDARRMANRVLPDGMLEQFFDNSIALLNSLPRKEAYDAIRNIIQKKIRRICKSKRFGGRINYIMLNRTLVSKMEDITLNDQSSTQMWRERKARLAFERLGVAYKANGSIPIDAYRVILGSVHSRINGSHDPGRVVTEYLRASQQTKDALRA